MKQFFEQIIKSWYVTPLPAIKPREVDLTKYFDPNIKKVISVIGFRRVGKTFTLLDFAQKTGKENCLYINFEDERIPKKTESLTALSETITEIKGTKPQVLMLDEIQEIPNWSLWVRRMNETTPHHLIISGSSSKLSSNEIPTELRGQTITLKIFPLNWKEFLSFKEVKNINNLPHPLIISFLNEYLKFGGLPEIVLAQEGLKSLILTDYYSTFVKRDVIDRYKIRNKDSLNSLLQLILNTRAFTYSRLTNNLKSLGHNIGKATIIRYMSYLKSSFFLSPISVFSPSIKKREQAAKKAYIIDNYFSTQFSSNFSQNVGHLMEQSVRQALEKESSTLPNLETYYWKDYSDHEIDFVKINNRNIECLIQVSCLSQNEVVPKREIDSLIKGAASLKCRNLFLITKDLEKTISQNKLEIKCVPLWHWLLNN